MSRNKEFSLGRGIATVATGGLAIASLYGMVREPDNAIFFGSTALVAGGLSVLIAAKADQINFDSALKDRPPHWPGL